MITKEIAMSLRYGQTLIHKWRNNTDGTPMRARVNGKCKTWKSKDRINEFRIPMKHGLKECFCIGFWRDPWEVSPHSENSLEWRVPKNGEEYEKRK